jgi:hypothetical protein
MEHENFLSLQVLIRNAKPSPSPAQSRRSSRPSFGRPQASKLQESFYPFVNNQSSIIKIINPTNSNSEKVFCSLGYSNVSNKSRVKFNSYLEPYASSLALHVLVSSLRISGFARVVSVAMELEPFHKG